MIVWDAQCIINLLGDGNEESRVKLYWLKVHEQSNRAKYCQKEQWRSLINRKKETVV